MLSKSTAPVSMKSLTGPPKRLLVPVTAFLALFYLIPLALITLMSAGHPPSFSLGLELLNLAHYTKFLSSPYYLKVLLDTVLLGLIVALITAILAYPVAYFLVRSRSRYRGFIYFVTLIPMAVGMNMITLGWLIVLGRNGFVNTLLDSLGFIDQPLGLLYTWPAMVVGLVNVIFTFMVLPIAAVLKNVDPSLERAARNLGAGPVRTFLMVTLPLSAEGVAAGFLAVFMQTSGALVMPLLLGGTSNTVLSVSIWEQYAVANDRYFAAVLSLILLAAALSVLWLQLKISKSREVL